jgi:hypothetical protein
VIPQRDAAGRQLTNAYDLAPLLTRLARLADGAAALIPAVQQGTGTGMQQASSMEDGDPKSFDLDSMAPCPRRHEDAAPGCPAGVDVLGEAVLALGAALGDDTPHSSLTRVTRLVARAGLAPEEAVRLLAEAQARTLQREDAPRHAMPYCLAAFESLLRPQRVHRTPGRLAPPRTRVPRTQARVIAAPREVPEVWTRVLSVLGEVLAPEVVQQRLAPLHVRRDGDCLVLPVPSAFERAWVERVLRRHLDAALRAVGEQLVQVVVLIEPGGQAPASAPAA